MAVETAALARQQRIENAQVAAPPRILLRRQLIAFVALVGVVELTWLVMLFELVRRLV